MVPLCGGGAGARLLRMAGAGRRLLLLNAARGSGSQAGGSAYTRGKALAVKKRGYDITRNPHLNKSLSVLSSLAVGNCAEDPRSGCVSRALSQ